MPDLTVLLDIDPEAGLARVACDRPGGPIGSSGRRWPSTSGSGPAFSMLAEAEPERYLVVDAGRPVDRSRSRC